MWFDFAVDEEEVVHAIDPHYDTLTRLRGVGYLIHFERVLELRVVEVRTQVLHDPFFHFLLVVGDELLQQAWLVEETYRSSPPVRDELEPTSVFHLVLRVRVENQAQSAPHVLDNLRWLFHGLLQIDVFLVE
jgi:hypothetical protein